MGQQDKSVSQDANQQTSQRPAQDQWRQQPAEEPGNASKDGKPSPAPGEKLHGDKLQNATKREP